MGARAGSRREVPFPENELNMNDEHNPFSDVPSTARGHLGLLFYEAVCRLILHLASRARGANKPFSQVFESFPFLSSYWNELRSRFPDTADSEEMLLVALRKECDRWEQSCGEWLPLRAVRQQASLSPQSLTCLMLAGLPEEDSHFGGLFGALQHPLGYRRPTLGLLQSLMQMENGNTDAWSLCRPLMESGLLVAPAKESPRAEWALRVPPALWSALRGDAGNQPLPGTQRHSAETFTAVSELILTAERRGRLGEFVGLLRTNRARTLVVRGMPGSPRLEVAGSVAHELGYGLLEVDGASLAADDESRRLIGPLCVTTRSIPVFNLELGPGETFELPSLLGYAGPAAILAGREGGLAGPLMERSVTVNLDPESPEQRLSYWSQELKDHSREELGRIAKCFTLPGGSIRRAAQIAAAHASLDRRSKITTADVREAVRTISRQRLDSLATRLADAGAWSQVVVSPSTERELRVLEERCRHREELAASFSNGFPGGLNRGVRALFEGPSGTGKTLAARVLATELELDLYRVDLAAVVNKYIGETEKNLSRILGRAEDLDVILLLDEGDSLMTRRTDVKSAHDRYANLETNYLLQRLETYTGIVIVTTNVGSAIDSAFRRRLDVVVKFHLPDAEQRWRLWQVHLPMEHAVPPAELEQVALRYEMTGGQIRNAAVQAALNALGHSRLQISADDLKNSIHLEYRKAGAAVPVDQNGNEEAVNQGGRLSGFLAAIS